MQNLAPELAKPYIDGGIVGDIITYFVFTLAGAEMWQRAFAAKNRRSAKEGLFLGTLAYGLTIPLVWFMGVVAHQLVPAEKIAAYGSTDAVVPALAIEILPVGLTGLALAGILSVIMSTADSYLIVSVQTCVHDIYKVFRPDTPERKELRLTRVFAVVLPLGALLIALYIKTRITSSCLLGASMPLRRDFRRSPRSIGKRRRRQAFCPAWRRALRSRSRGSCWASRSASARQCRGQSPVRWRSCS